MAGPLGARPSFERARLQPRRRASAENMGFTPCGSFWVAQRFQRCDKLRKKKREQHREGHDFQSCHSRPLKIGALAPEVGFLTWNQTLHHRQARTLCSARHWTPATKLSFPPLPDCQASRCFRTGFTPLALRPYQNHDYTFLDSKGCTPPTHSPPKRLNL
jgi:hypothetical protein